MTAFMECGPGVAAEVAARLQGIYDAFARPKTEYAASFKVSMMGRSRQPSHNTLQAAGFAQHSLDPTTMAKSNILAPTLEGSFMLELTLPTMTCGHCVGVVTQAIQQADPRATVEIDLASHRVRVESTEDHQTIESAVIEAGYTPG